MAGSHTPARQVSAASATNAHPSAVLLAEASPEDYIPQPPGPKAPTSPGAVLDELLKLLWGAKQMDAAVVREGNSRFANIPAGT
jgi:hypothetical protein